MFWTAFPRRVQFMRPSRSSEDADGSSPFDRFRINRRVNNNIPSNCILLAGPRSCGFLLALLAALGAAEAEEPASRMEMRSLEHISSLSSAFESSSVSHTTRPSMAVRCRTDTGSDTSRRGNHTHSRRTELVVSSDSRRVLSFGG